MPQNLAQPGAEMDPRLMNYLAMMQAREAPPSGYLPTRERTLESYGPLARFQPPEPQAEVRNYDPRAYAASGFAGQIEPGLAEGTLTGAMLVGGPKMPVPPLKAAVGFPAAVGAGSAGVAYMNPEDGMSPLEAGLTYGGGAAAITMAPYAARAAEMGVRRAAPYANPKNWPPSLQKRMPGRGQSGTPSVIPPGVINRATGRPGSAMSDVDRAHAFIDASKATPTVTGAQGARSMKEQKRLTKAYFDRGAAWPVGPQGVWGRDQSDAINEMMRRQIAHEQQQAVIEQLSKGIRRADRQPPR